MRMNLRTISIFWAATALSSCGPADVLLERSGPRLTATLERQWVIGDGPARQAAFSADGALLATSSAAGDIVIRKAPDWRIANAFKVPGGATSVAFTADGMQLFTGGYDGIVHGWTLADGHETRRLTGAKGTVWSIDIRPDGQQIAAGGQDGEIHLWPVDGNQGPPATLKGHSRIVWNVRYSPEGSRLASGSFDTTARTWDMVKMTPTTNMRGHGQAVVGLDYSPDGATIATGGDDSTLRSWMARDGRLTRTIHAPNHIYSVEFSPDGRWIATSGRARGGAGTFWHQLTGQGATATPVHIWRSADGALIAALPHPDDIMSATFSPDMQHLATSGEDGRIRLWRLNATS